MPTVVPKQPQRSTPYIYNREELRRLIEATYTYRYGRLIEPHTFRSLLLLLYGTGVRISEALSLTLADVDLPEAIVTVRDTKFYKTRLVPLGTQLRDVLVEYAKRRKNGKYSQDKSAPFFVTRRSAALTASSNNRSNGYASLLGCAALMAHAINHVCMTCVTHSLFIG